MWTLFGSRTGGVEVRIATMDIIGIIRTNVDINCTLNDDESINVKFLKCSNVIVLHKNALGARKKQS